MRLSIAQHKTARRRALCLYNSTDLSQRQADVLWVGGYRLRLTLCALGIIELANLAISFSAISSVEMDFVPHGRKQNG